VAGTPAGTSGLSTAAQISKLVVQTVNSYMGRGPTRGWTSIDNDLVSVVLRDTLTKGERSLVNDSRTQLALDMRKAYQTTMRAELVSGVEQIIGRKVIAFLSDNHINPDIQIESFVLEPAADGVGSEASGTSRSR